MMAAAEDEVTQADLKKTWKIWPDILSHVSNTNKTIEESHSNGIFL